MPNPYESLEKYSPHEVIIFPTFHKNWAKILDILLRHSDFRITFLIKLRLYILIWGGGYMNVHMDIGRWSLIRPWTSTWGGWVVKNGQNLVHMVIEWPLSPTNTPQKVMASDLNETRQNDNSGSKFSCKQIFMNIWYKK